VVKPTAYLSLGSNLGDRAENLRQAIGLLENLGTVTAVSSFYETEPVEVEGSQPWFVNMVVALETELTPRELLSRTLEIERGMGRQRTSAKGPRTIDIDIVLLDDTILNVPGLVIPHPAMHRRRFVLEPLAEIAPDIENPVFHKRASDLLRGLPQGEGQVRRFEGPRIQNRESGQS
jgi:2-amino-4-hydroxy-6-hydroxymethyldihydropteridine diphosphokinase